MRYSQIRSMDISNGEGIGIALFTQGCKFHCKNCFNQETWDLNGGKLFDQETENKFLSLLNNKFITRVSILGGEPLLNPYEIFLLCEKIKEKRHDVKIWIYSGYTYEEIIKSRELTKAIINSDILVDGRFIDKLKDFNLLFRGSSNQRIIDVKQSLKNNKVIFWNSEKYKETYD